MSKHFSGRRKGIALSYIHFGLNVVLSIVISAFIIRRVGKTDYGVYQAMTAFISYLVLLEFGTSALMTRNISLLKKDGTDDDKIKKNISTIWSLTIILSLLIAVFAFVFYLLIGFIYSNSFTDSQIILGKKLFIVAAVNLLFTFLTSTLNGLIIAYEYYTFSISITLAKLILRTVLIFVLLWLKQDIFIVAIVDGVLGFFCLLITLLFCIIKLKSNLSFKYFDRAVLISSLPLAFAMLLQTIVNTANGIVDKFLISIMMTPEDVTVYSISMTIFNMYSSIATLPVTMFMPAIAAEIKKGISEEELTVKLIPACRLNVTVTGLIGLGFFIVGKQFITISYGAEYVEAWKYAMLVIVPMFFNMTNSVIVNVLDIYNKRHVRSIILLITTAINVGITIFGIKYFGMVGAALGTAISLVLQIVILNIYYNNSIKIRIIKLFKESFKGILPALIFAAFAAFPIQNRIHNHLISFFVGGLIFIIVFLAMFLSFGCNESEKQKITNLLNKIKKAFHRKKRQLKN